MGGPLLVVCERGRGKRAPTLGQGDRGAPSYLKVGSIGCEEFGSVDGPLPQSNGSFLLSVLSVFQPATILNYNTRPCRRLEAIPQIRAGAVPLGTRSLMGPEKLLQMLQKQKVLKEPDVPSSTFRCKAFC